MECAKLRNKSEKSKLLSQKLFRLGNGVEFANIEKLKLGVKMAMDGNFIANGQVEVDDGELALPRVHEGKKGGMENLDAGESILL